MYLTRFRLNTARSGTRKLLASPQAMHAAVMASFPTLLPSAADRPRVLWRVDRTSRAEVFLHIVSPPKPDLTHLAEQAGWPTQPEWQTHDYTPFLSGLAKGDVWAFRLTANPVHTIRRRPGEPTKPTAHVTPRHQRDWLLRRQDAAGFRVVEKPVEQRRLPEGDEYELVIHNRQRHEFTKRTSKGTVSLVTVTFDGRLEVTDPNALRRTLTMGLGRAKAYGCGLMTLAPVG
ncbi:type I-E CRISPR-associated protein Cas6/Cse3/CasE [Thermobifida cellulosilytica]|uniref:CRISPR-associated protein Cse3 n=1 Tax=Thermobifida cellulosilytica TB100 TaxID=665004 RepID=A0A147KJG8_THECS|nr:type I-E CRISPR-associated protein Cas6/Cse3/CasE [Thermobifida cellulosilytica]KUP97436.1 CRISPR-associated protein Cse3 [Thermobifida cellulosilytica TB100]